MKISIAVGLAERINALSIESSGGVDHLCDLGEIFG